MKVEQFHLEEIKRYFLDMDIETRKKYAIALLPDGDDILRTGWFAGEVYLGYYTKSSAMRMLQHHKRGKKNIPDELVDSIITGFFNAFYQKIKEALDIEVVVEEEKMEKIHVMDLKYKYKLPIVEVGTLVYPKRVGELDDGKVIEATTELIKIREKSGKHRSFTPDEFKEEYYT